MRIFISASTDKAVTRSRMVRVKREPAKTPIPPERQKQILIKAVTSTLERKYYYELTARIKSYNLERMERNGEKITAAERKALNKKIAEYKQLAEDMTIAYASALADVKKSGIKIAKSELPSEKDQKKTAENTFKEFKEKADALDAKKAKQAVKALKAKPKSKT